MTSDDDFLSTTQCANKLNLAYGWKAMTRQRMLNEIRSGRLPHKEVPAAGSRSRALIRVANADFLDYCLVYHRSVSTAIKAICKN